MLFPLGTVAQAQTLAAGDRQEARSILSLAEGWRFKLGEEALNADRPDFVDADWATVRVPHSWNRVGNYLTPDAGRINSPDNLNKTQGVGWYRLRFTPPASFRGKRAYLQFDAASRTAEIWLNGHRLGTHRGGFSRFRLDVTDALKPGQTNVLVVKADNSNPEADSATADVLPLRGDFFVYGGLYRPVSLVATAPVHLDMLDFGGSGVYATTRSIAADKAAVDVRIRLRNDESRPAPVQLVSRLIDAAGKIAAEQVQPLTVKGHAGLESVHKLSLVTPRLWQGTQDPYLYRLAVEVRSPSGAVLDRVEQPYGVRQFRMDPEKGFFLNGKPLKLHGVGYHQDREGKGWASAPEDVESDVKLLREMGVNTIRLAHYQHGQPIHELADRYGIILWDEIPFVSAWTWGKAMEADDRLRANARQQLQELIRQNYNHASVVTWGIANEVDFGNSQLSYVVNGVRTPTPDPVPLLRELDALAKAEDQSRPTVLATCCEGRPFPADVDVPFTAEGADLSGVNRYFGWYYGTTQDLGPNLDMLRRRRPAQPLAISEYGAGGATSVHTDHPLGGQVSIRGREQPEEYLSYFHEQSWATIAARPYLWSTWLWNGFNFATTMRREGDADDINTKGMISFDRRIRKDPYFFYKANWTDTPTVHINGRRYVDRRYQATDVRVYSNAPATELFVNGRSAGVLSDCGFKTCVWQVRLAPGSNQVVARGRFPTGEVEDSVRWQLQPESAATVRIDSGALIPASDSPRRFGSDAFFDGGTPRTVDKIPIIRGEAPRTAQVTGEDPGIARTYRAGTFRYAVPLDNGRYTVTLTFLEPDLPVGARLFDVIANGRTQLTGFDVHKAAGALLTSVKRRFPVTVTGGVLDLQFRARQGEALVSAVEIERR
ncbi:malectin domain-containing carbohydrate-binding protein [Sphingobium sp. JS3065]|nr:glycoside hydrolase family 2 TIM barrel-domain containing protein [Sphingobium sp. JS3065]UZW57824.1 malectin domain-containing carbohydrate-binding protein [Sphingobium sp. JS3065]